MKEIGIKPIVINEIVNFAEKYGLETVILFGSRAKGNYEKASDIDLAVKGGMVDKFAIAMEEETSTLLKFDIINMDKTIQEKLLKAIQKEGVILYEKV